jgi:malonyl-CoA O-methyltransferase
MHRPIVVLRYQSGHASIGVFQQQSVVTCEAMSPGEVQRQFDGAAGTFDSADFVLATTRDGLLARLEPITIDARYVIDLGSATGSAGRALERRFKRAHILAIDLSQEMLRKAQSKKSWLSKTAFLQADAAALPFSDHSVDVVFANQLLPWMPDSAPVFAEISRVLRQDGLFLFSTLGPDSLRGLRHEPFADMHDVGDALVGAGLRDPVLDVDRLAVTYENTGSLMDDFSAIGARHCIPDEIEEMSLELKLELELVYGHCWGGGRRSAGGEYSVDARQIGTRNR